MFDCFARFGVKLKFPVLCIPFFHLICYCFANVHTWGKNKQCLYTPSKVCASDCEPLSMCVQFVHWKKMIVQLHIDSELICRMKEGWDWDAQRFSVVCTSACDKIRPNWGPPPAPVPPPRIFFVLCCFSYTSLVKDTCRLVCTLAIMSDSDIESGPRTAGIQQQPEQSLCSSRKISLYALSCFMVVLLMIHWKWRSIFINSLPSLLVWYVPVSCVCLIPCTLIKDVPFFP
jgi:hypothetical protein